MNTEMVKIERRRQRRFTGPSEPARYGHTSLPPVIFTPLRQALFKLEDPYVKIHSKMTPYFQKPQSFWLPLEVFGFLGVFGLFLGFFTCFFFEIKKSATF